MLRLGEKIEPNNYDVGVLNYHIQDTSKNAQVQHSRHKNNIGFHTKQKTFTLQIFTEPICPHTGIRKIYIDMVNQRL